MHSLLLFSLLACTIPLYTTAHQFDRGDITVTLHAKNEYQLETVITAPDRLPPLDVESTGTNSWEHHVQTRLQIAQSTAPCYFSLKEFTHNKKEAQTYITGTYQCPEKITRLSQHTIYVSLFGEHYEYPHITLLATFGDETSRLHFTKYKRQYPHDVHAEHVGYGIAHIIGDTAHVLFLIALCLLPFLYLLKKQLDRRTIIILASCIIAAVALYWTVTRLL